MTIRLARTNAEAHLYMDLRPCETCGATDYRPRGSVVMVEGDLGSRYRGPCLSCGTEREYTFRIPQQILPPGDTVRYGGPDPSDLLDPGEWLWVADTAASRVPVDPGELPPDERARHAYFLGVAVAAVEEVMKFIPDGADRVPEDAFVSERGREVRAAEPGRFSKPRLDAVLESYRAVAARFGERR